MMTHARWAIVGTLTLCVASAAGTGLARGNAADAARPVLVSSHDQTTPPPPPVAPRSAPAQTPATAGVATASSVVTTYCTTCHNDMMKRGELSLVSFDVAKAETLPQISEKMIRKLQAGMMPPPGSKRPDEATLATLISVLESRIDTAAAANPNPGSRPFPRLNRPEYAAAIKEIVGLDIDSGKWLPLDQKSANFDNIADEQVLSATLLESYLNAAADISRLAVGDRNAPTLGTTYTNTSYLSQHPWDRLDGAPFGTRGGLVTKHVFPADAEYVFELVFQSGNNSRFEDVDLSLNGERITLLRYETGQSGGADGRGGFPMKTEPILVRAGQYDVAAAFVRRMEGPYDDLIRPHDWSFAGGGSGGAGITTLPHLRDLIIHGPFRATGVSETPSRQKIFTCRPTAATDARACARAIVGRLAAVAYRRPVQARETDSLMQFYDLGAAKGGGFEGGVHGALEAILVSPHFIFRLERQPETARPGQAHRVTDVDLASRLSFFVWGTPPDQALLDAASRGELGTVKGLEQHTRRLLADPRGAALGSRFAGQWLRLQDIDKVHPDPNFFPNFDDQIAMAMRRETEAFFNHLVQADRSFLEFFSADYTFLNERLARHYGVPGVTGSHFRRVTYPDASRRGILGHGSMLVQTSMANRTSPVLRGKWVMEVLLGTPPPPPPPDVPTLEEVGEAKDGRQMTTREKMEAHRSNPTCNACHRFMDPIGLALDSFDVTGKLRMRELGSALDTRGDFYDGTRVQSPAELATVLLKRPVPLVRTFTENLLSYALGRRVEYFDMPAIRRISRAAEANNYRMSSFVVGVVTSDAFRMKLVEADTAQDAKSGGRR